MKIKHIMKVVSCAFALTGCMSLEERLMSTDAAVKRAAEYELVSKAHRSGSLDTCVAAVERVSDRDLLRTVALQAKSSYAQEGVAAVKKLTEQDDFKAIAAGAHAELVAEAAYMRIKDQTVLLEMAKQTKQAYIRRVAAVVVLDKKSLLPVVVAHIDDKELIEKYVSHCKDENVLCELIDSCGDKIPEDQVKKIQVKAETQALKDSIAAIEDIRIGNELKIRCSGGRLCMEPGHFVEQFRKIKSLKVRNEVLFESLENLDDKDRWNRDDKSWKEIVSLVDAECIMRCTRKSFSRQRDKDILVEFVNGERVPDLYAMMTKDGGFAPDALLESLTSQENVVRMIKAFPDDVREEDLLTVVNKIKSPEAAEAFLSRDFVSKQKFGSDMEKILVKMLRAISLVGGAEKQRVLNAIKNGVDDCKDKIGIGPFYLGMPYYEAVVLAGEEGLRGNNNDIWFGWDDNLDKDYNQEPFYKQIMKDWKKNLVVTSIGLSKKGSIKYLDCEDSVIFQQAIKQCVKKENGKAKPYDYIGEIKHTAKLDSSRVTEIKEYSSTKLGVRLSFVENDGILVFLKTE